MIGFLFAAALALAPHEQLAFDIYRELVEIDTVTASGDALRTGATSACR